MPAKFGKSKFGQQPAGKGKRSLLKKILMQMNALLQGRRLDSGLISTAHHKQLSSGKRKTNIY